MQKLTYKGLCVKSDQGLRQTVGLSAVLPRLIFLFLLVFFPFIFLLFPCFQNLLKRGLIIWVIFRIGSQKPIEDFRSFEEKISPVEEKSLFIFGKVFSPAYLDS